MDPFAKAAGLIVSLFSAAAGVPAAFTGIAKVIAVLAAIAGGLLWLRSEIAETATAAAEARCEKRIAAIVKTQSTEADNRAQSADDAAEAVVRARDRAALERVCQGDPTCRDRRH